MTISNFISRTRKAFSSDSRFRDKVGKLLQDDDFQSAWSLPTAESMKGWMRNYWQGEKRQIKEYLVGDISRLHQAIKRGQIGAFLAKVRGVDIAADDILVRFRYQHPETGIVEYRNIWIKKHQVREFSRDPRGWIDRFRYRQETKVVAGAEPTHYAILEEWQY